MARHGNGVQQLPIQTHSEENELASEVVREVVRRVSARKRYGTGAGTARFCSHRPGLGKAFRLVLDGPGKSRAL